MRIERFFRCGLQDTGQQQLRRTLVRQVRWPAFLLFIIMMVSCEKVIDLPLRNAALKYVVEGNVSDGSDTARVLLSQTKPFSDSNGFAGITGAVISISDNGGTPVFLDEVRPGVYEATGMQGIPGHTYDLQVQVGGEVFTASSQMPLPVSFDTLFVDERLRFSRVRKVAVVRYPDPPGKGNSYRFIKYINGVKDDNIFVRDDKLTDGNLVETELRGGIERGDTVRIDMLCVDPAIYRFWFTLEEGATGEEENAAPANPESNIRGGALGYFSAHTFRTRTVIAD